MATVYGGITMDTEEIKKLQAGLSSLPAEIPKVTSLAINYATAKARTYASRAIRSRYNISQKRLYDEEDKVLHMVKATPDNLSGGLVAYSTHFALGYFNILPSAPHPGPPRPVIKASVIKGSSKPVPGAFVAVMKSGHSGVFQRIAASALTPKIGKRGNTLAPKQALSQLYTIGVAEMFEQHDIINSVDKEAHDAFEYEFGRQADRALGHALGKPA
jgi:hypothetical protein